MSRLQLSTSDLANLADAHRVLLPPQGRAEADNWQLRANRAVRYLVGADHSEEGAVERRGPLRL